MAGIDSGTGVAGSSFTHYVYPGIYQNQVCTTLRPITPFFLSEFLVDTPILQDFHHCGLEPNDEIVNYDNRLEVQTCQLDNLAEYAIRCGLICSVFILLLEV